MLRPKGSSFKEGFGGLKKTYGLKKIFFHKLNQFPGVFHETSPTFFRQNKQRIKIMGFRVGGPFM